MSDGPTRTWSSRGAYSFAIVCLLIGVAAGYLIRGTATGAPAAAGNKSAPEAAAATTAGQDPPTPDRMRHMADAQAAPLLAKLRQTPNDPALLAAIADVYYQTQNLPEAIGYYEKSLAVKDDPDVRTKLGGVYFHSGEWDKAIAEFEGALKTDPKNANALFDLGVARWQGKGDTEGAIAAWQRLLKENPHHPRRAEVENLITLVRKHAGMKAGDKPLAR